MILALLWRYRALAVAGGLVVVALGWHGFTVWQARRDGAAAAVQKIENANTDAMNRADGKTIDVISCPLDKPWDRRAGKCAP